MDSLSISAEKAMEILNISKYSKYTEHLITFKFMRAFTKKECPFTYKSLYPHLIPGFVPAAEKKGRYQFIHTAVPLLTLLYKYFASSVFILTQPLLRFLPKTASVMFPSLSIATE